jgi:DNA repair protein RecN (Recombination protein N)
MLTELRIENFAIIQQLELTFSTGLITFTGETGAGKSIILDAILALMGGKVDATLIRAGADRALVEATFKLDGTGQTAVLSILKEQELYDEDDNYLTLSREIKREGRSTARVNGRSVNVTMMREIGGYLVDIHGQSEHLSLLNVRQHVGLLDRYTGIIPQIQAYQRAYHFLKQLRQELEDLRREEAEAAQRIELLKFQVEEIDAANLRPDEEEELRQERDRLSNAEHLSEAAQQTLALLDDGTEEIPPISDLVGEVVESLTTLSRRDPTQEELSNQAVSLAETLADISRNLGLYLEQVEHNPQRLEQVEEQLDMINDLKRKYGGSIEAILAHAEKTRQQLKNIAQTNERIGEMEEEERLLIRTMAAKALTISNLRAQAAETLNTAIENELDDLNMEGARFLTEIRHQESSDGLPLEDGKPPLAFDENGVDQIEFLIAPNPGEGFKPLAKTASGGETSRLMLALKNVLAQADHVPTLIFDEVDQGIGGRVGVVVGEKLWQLGRRHQVLCVTHLPQLAAFGDQHYRVRKLTGDGRTTTEVHTLNEAERLDEMALMLGSVSETNRSAAQEALDAAHQRMARLKEGA